MPMPFIVAEAAPAGGESTNAAECPRGSRRQTRRQRFAARATAAGAGRGLVTGIATILAATLLPLAAHAQSPAPTAAAAPHTRALHHRSPLALGRSPLALGRSPLARGQAPLALGQATLARIAAAVSATAIADDIQSLVSFGTRSTITDTGTDLSAGTTAGTGAPAAAPHRGVAAARAWIEQQFQADAVRSGGRMQVHLDWFEEPAGPRLPRPLRLANVVAVLPGTDANDHRVFLVGGHYDSIPSFPHDILNPALDAPGANDDASGTAVVLECARVLSRYRFPATLIFVAFEGEEQGLFGSEHFAQAAHAQGLKIAGMLNNDIVGGDQTPGQQNRARVRLFSQGLNPALPGKQIRQVSSLGAENDSRSRELARYIQDVTAGKVPGFQALLEYRPDRYLRGGDQMSFNEQGYAAVRFTDEHENYDHQHQTPRRENGVDYGDLLRFTSPRYTANVARLNALALAALAATPAPPAHVFMAAKLERGTTLHWDAVRGAAGYDVLLRPTASAHWTHRIATRGTTIHLAESKDNFVIAIAARNAAGLAGLPTVAVMEGHPTLP